MSYVAQSAISLANVGSPELRKDTDDTWSPAVQNDQTSGSVAHSKYGLLDSSIHSTWD